MTERDRDPSIGARVATGAAPQGESGAAPTIAGRVPIGGVWVDGRGRMVRRVGDTEEARRKRCIVVEVVVESTAEPGLRMGSRHLIAASKGVQL